MSKTRRQTKPTAIKKSNQNKTKYKTITSIECKSNKPDFGNLLVTYFSYTN